MNIFRIYLVSKLTVLYLFKKKIFYVLFFASSAITIGALFVNFFGLGAQSRLIKDISLSAISFFAIILSLGLSSTIISSEIENKSIYPVITKPIRRYEYILGKYFGVLFIILINLLVLSTILFVIFYFKNKEFLWGFYAANYFVFLQCAIIAGFCILFSLMTTAPVTFSLGVLVYYIGNISQEYLSFLMSGTTNIFTGIIMEFLKVILPNLNYFSLKSAVVHSYIIPLKYVGLVTCYGVLYTSLLIGIILMVFEDRDL